MNTPVSVQPPYTTIKNWKYIQTFYADPDVVNKSGECNLTSIELFFQYKPDVKRNASGKSKPKVSIIICDVEKDEPKLTKCYSESLVVNDYDDVYESEDSSIATVFSFKQPVKLKTGRFYGIVMILDDPGYKPWVNRQGFFLAGTQTTSTGSSIVKDGKLFAKTNASVFKPLNDRDLKFSVKVAKYSDTVLNEIFVNKNYEFITYNSSGYTGPFLGGEWVYQRTANSTGTIRTTAGSKVIRGTGTAFDNFDTGVFIVAQANSTVSDVLKIENVTNSTYMSVTTPVSFTVTGGGYAVPPVGRVSARKPVSRLLYLVESNANSTVKFGVGNSIIGSDSGASAVIGSLGVLSVDRVRIKGDIVTPPGSKIKTSFTSAYYDGSTYTFSTNLKDEVKINDKIIRDISKYDGFILSRSLEVDNASMYSNNALRISRKSLKVDVNMDIDLPSTALYKSPIIKNRNLHVYAAQNKISNAYMITDANTVSIDSEVSPVGGTAISRHISKKVTFAPGRYAEDVRVYMTAYRPLGTDLKVYVRVHNAADPEAFDDKSWTPLDYTVNGNTYSSARNDNDFIEYELGIPQYSPTANVIPGTFTTQLSNSVIISNGSNPTTYVTQNDVIKLYNPLIPQDYIIASVQSANSTTITLGNSIANNNVVGSGFKVDRLKYYFTAFNNITNDNVARYYNTSLVEFDKFDSMQVKIVLLANNTYLVPKVDNIQVIGVSA